MTKIISKTETKNTGSHSEKIFPLVKLKTFFQQNFENTNKLRNWMKLLDTSYYIFHRSRRRLENCCYSAGTWDTERWYDSRWLFPVALIYSYRTPNCLLRQQYYGAVRVVEAAANYTLFWTTRADKGACECAYLLVTDYPRRRLGKSKAMNRLYQR